jgi:hypothetical protein
LVFWDSIFERARRTKRNDGGTGAPALYQGSRSARAHHRRAVTQEFRNGSGSTKYHLWWGHGVLSQGPIAVTIDKPLKSRVSEGLRALKPLKYQPIEFKVFSADMSNDVDLRGPDDECPQADPLRIGPVRFEKMATALSLAGRASRVIQGVDCGSPPRRPSRPTSGLSKLPRSGFLSA